ncbi:hydroxysqualene dehydroxylase [Antrihabitans cavernicola]|uniref:hydroxysqualene dehydroxylase n=1 Tax=Antrihabitans cavernicola TaxID=2495913 RepID=UPI001659CB6D|nr:FAD-dependent oxidoreductase [Spelaeibacter cavernicola]
MTLSRRAFVAGAAAVGAATLLPARGRASGRNRVAVFGGGMSGLVVAHELIERGFAVDIFDARPVAGGKARSFGVPGSAVGGRAELPAEHGFRFFPGFYRNVPDSMRRIPFAGNSNGVLDNLRDIASLSDDDGFGGAVSLGPGESVAGFLPLNLSTGRPVELGRLADLDYLSAVVGDAATQLMGIPRDRFPGEVADFGRCVAAYLTSSTQRRQTQWDGVSWWNFLRAETKSKYFQDAVAKMTTLGLVAVKPQVCSVNSAGNIIEAFLWNVLVPRPGPDDSFVARFLDGPTSQVWIEPWVAELRRRGAAFHFGQALREIEVGAGIVSGATVVDGSGAVRAVDADFYVSAIPVDQAVDRLRTPSLLRLDPSLDAIRDLHVDWMNGLMIYLRKPLEAARGLFGIVDHPWTLSAISQRQTWSRDIAREFGDGSAGDIISVDISNWDGVGITAIRKTAKQCTREEIFTEVWATLKERFGRFDRSIVDGNVHSWFLDPAITWAADGTVHNAEPLTVQTVNTWAKRPKGPTAIPNLFIAGDWIQTNANVVSMEGANQSGRVVAQAVLDASGRNAEPVVRYDYYVPPELEPIKALDAQRFAAHQPNFFE